MSQSLNHFVCEHGLHWTDQPNLFIMDRKCQRNVTIRPGLIWPELSSDQMTNVQDEDGGRAMMGWSLPPVMRSRHQLANRLRSLELHTTSDSFIITMFGDVQQWILTGHRIYWNYLHVFNSYHQVTTHATIPLIAFDIIINSWLNSMII